jgi:hypothetical protein
MDQVNWKQIAGGSIAFIVIGSTRRAHWMRLAALVIVLALFAGCVPVPSLTPQTPPSEARPSATQPPGTQALPTEAAAQPPTTAPAAVPSAAAPVAGPLAVVKAFEEAYNRHDVDAAAGLFAADGCIAWGDRGECGYWSKQRLLYDAALNRELALSDCSVAGGRVTCKAVQRDVCLEAGGLGETHFAPVVFIFEAGKMLLVQATKTPEDAQRDLLFLYKLAGWAHRTRPAEWEKAGRGDLLDNQNYSPPFVDRTGAVQGVRRRGGRDDPDSGRCTSEGAPGNQGARPRVIHRGQFLLGARHRVSQVGRLGPAIHHRRQQVRLVSERCVGSPLRTWQCAR